MDGGFGDNDWEGSVSTHPDHYTNKHTVQTARTRLAYHKDIPVLFMEYVRYVPYSKINNRPEWVDYVDGQQVGYNKSGRLVAFDYGRN